MRSNMLMMTLALAFSAVAATAAGAQQTSRPQGQARAEQQGMHRGRGGPGERGRGPEGFLLRGITLSAAQQAQLDSMHAQMRAQFQAERGQRGQRGQQGASDADRQAFRAKMQERREQMTARLRGILTPDQQKQFDKNVADMKAHQGQRGGWKRGK